MSDKSYLQKLNQIISGFGGELITIDKQQKSLDDIYYLFKEHSDLEIVGYTNNFVAFDWEFKKIFCEPTTSWSEILHVVGHVFYLKNRSFCPDDDCFDFFGREILLLNRIGATKEEWLSYNEEYSVELKNGDLVEIRDLSIEEFNELADYRLKIESTLNAR